jgi:hypothetical protein
MEQREGEKIHLDKWALRFEKVAPAIGKKYRD